VAVERKLPQSWYAKGEKPAKARIGVIGNGGVFVGAAPMNPLNPVKEKLLLDVSNWLLGRDDLLSQAKPENEWRYPRVELSESQKLTWFLVTLVLMPMAFLYAGLGVGLVRRMR
jgi:hypothetical protein